MSSVLKLPERVKTVLGSEQRLETLRRVTTSNGKNDVDFDVIASIAARTLNAPVALISMVDVEHQWFKSAHGTELLGTPIEQSFCSHTIAEDNHFLVIDDATRDDRFVDNPLVTGEAHVRFYAGSSIEVDNQFIGTVCVLDREPRDGLSPEQVATLKDLAALAARMFEYKDKDRELVENRDELHLVRDLHRAATDAGRVATWVWNLKTDRVSGNKWLPILFGNQEGFQMTAENLLERIVPVSAEKVRAALAASINDDVEYNLDFEMIDGRWLTGRGRVFQRDSEGKALSMIGTNVDITGTKTNAERTKFLLREINHRVKNTLAMLQSLARHTLKKHPEPELFMETFSARLSSIAAAHTLLSDSEWRPVSLRALIDQQITPYVYRQHDGGLVQQGDDIELPSEQALGMGVLLHELATNAAKYGAFTVPEGIVKLEWKVTGLGVDRMLVMNWKETGGPKVGPAGEAGFGSFLIKRSLDKILNSRVELSLEEDGLNAKIKVPLRVY